MTAREKSCPRCRFPLASTANDDAVLDPCAICHGSFFEPHELLARFGEDGAPDAWVKGGLATHIGETRLRCPVDESALVAYRLAWSSDAEPVEIDACPSCRGLWLDEGEAPKIAAVLTAHDDERAAAEKLSFKKYLFQLFTGFPVEVWNPVRAPARATRGLTLALVAVWLIETALLFMDRGAAEELFLFLAIDERRAFTPSGLHTLVTHGLLHAGLFHLVSNVYMLWIFGDNVEDRLGVRRYLALFFAALVAGGLVHVLFDARGVPMVGASGAISGVMAAYFVMFPRVKLRLVWAFIPFQLSVAWYFGLWLALQAVMAVLHSGNVAWLAHIGGALTGLVVGRIDRAYLDDKARRAAEQKSELLPKRARH